MTTDHQAPLPLEDLCRLPDMPAYRQAVDELLSMGWDMCAAQELAALYLTTAKPEGV